MNLKQWRTAAFAVTLGSLLCAAQLNFTPFHANGIYGLGEKAGWTVTRTDSAAASVSYTIKKNNIETIKSGALDLTSGTANIEVTLTEPAMLYVEVLSGE